MKKRIQKILSSQKEQDFENNKLLSKISDLNKLATQLSLVVKNSESSREYLFDEFYVCCADSEWCNASVIYLAFAQAKLSSCLKDFEFFIRGSDCPDWLIALVDFHHLSEAL